MDRFISSSSITNMFYSIHNNLYTITKNSNEKNEGDYVFFHNVFQGNNKGLILQNESQVLESMHVKQQNLVMLLNMISGNVLEIGFNAGHSAAIMLNYNRDITLTIIDNCQHAYTKPCYEYLKDVYKDRLILLEGDSRYILPNLKETYDMIHIDGCHETSCVEQDLVNSKRLLRSKGILLVNDTQDDNIRSLIKQNLKNQYINLELDCVFPLQHEAFVKL